MRDSLHRNIIAGMSMTVAILSLPWLVTGVVAASALVASVASRRCRDAIAVAIWGE